MIMNQKLYPPIIEGALPAFYGNAITISYTLNRGVGYDDIYGFSLIIKSTVTNQIIRTRQVLGKPGGAISFSLTKETNEVYDLLPGSFYKVQLAFLDKNEKIGHYSNVGIVKYLGPNSPVLSIDTEAFNTVGCFTGIYTPSGIYNEEKGKFEHDLENGDITEKLYSYKFSLYDSYGKLIETSGEVLHNSTEDVGLVQRDNWFPRYGLDNGSMYKIVYSITTINNLQLSQVTMVSPNKDEQGFVPNNLQLIADYSAENGVVTLLVKSNLPNDIRNLVYGKFQIFKTSSKDEFKSKERVAYFSLENQDLFEKSFKDFTVESGYRYRYVIQQINDYGIYSEEVYSNEVEVFYEHMYLFDGIRQLKIKFNPKVSSFKNTVFETKTDTIGGKYPFILRNPNVKYKEFALSGLISYHMDEENFFLSDAEIWKLSNKEELVPEWYKTHNLTDANISAEKVFKNYVLDWLNNGEVKLLKTATEGLYLVRLMNVSLSPNDTVGRMLHSFNATAYEVDDFTADMFTQALTIDRTKKYIGYKTIPLYNFPKKTIIEKTNDGKWSIVYNKNAYEIINNTALEYVTGARFEDIKPGTKFSIILERDNRTISFGLEIGATGTHRIDSLLGFHIKSIKLMASSWETGDYEKDIINNKGQITYEFERQANHNNFNDITKVGSDIIVGDMWCPTWYEAKIDEPLKTFDNKFLYRYSVIDNEAKGYIEVGYFKDKDGVLVTGKGEGSFLINGVDYWSKITSEGVKYYRGLENTDNQIFPIDKAGCLYEPGQYIVSYENSRSLQDTLSDGVVSTLDRFQWANQVYTFLEKETLMQVYKQENTDLIIKPDKYLSDGVLKVVEDNDDLFVGNNSYYKTLNNLKDVKANIFVQRYDEQGVVISQPVTVQQWINPYYVKLEIWDEKNDCLVTESLATKHKIKPVYSKEFFEIEKADNSINYAKDTIYKNFASNIYYNDTNVNDEYYMKEDIQALYKIDFELMQIFYEEDLQEKGLNFSGSAYVEYENINDDGLYAYTKQILSSYQETEDSEIVEEERRQATTHPGRVGDEQSYIREKIDKGESSYYISLYDLFTREEDSELLKKLFNFNSAYNNNSFGYDFDNIRDFQVGDGYVNTTTFYNNILNYFPGDLFYKKSVSPDLFLYGEAYYYNLIEPFVEEANLPEEILFIDKDKNQNINLNKVYVNVFIQATKNYTKDITPNDNEIVIIYATETKYKMNAEGTQTGPGKPFFGESYPQRIDLSERMSFTLEAGNYDQGLSNIIGIYLGKNVRAFATYKSKRYNYHALVGDGVYKDLNYEN